jgi:hypothetical protein
MIHLSEISKNNVNELNKNDLQKMPLSFIALLEFIFIDKKNQCINNEIKKTNIVLTKVM